MRKPIFYTGESIRIDLVVKDNDGNIIDLGNLADIEVSVFRNNSYMASSTYSLSGGDVYVDSAASGTCHVIIQGSETEDYRTGDYSVQVVAVDDETNFDPYRYRYGREEGLFEIRRGV